MTSKLSLRAVGQAPRSTEAEHGEQRASRCWSEVVELRVGLDDLGGLSAGGLASGH